MRNLIFISLIILSFKGKSQKQKGEYSLNKNYYSLKGSIKEISTFTENKELITKFSYNSIGNLTEIIAPHNDGVSSYSPDIQEDFMHGYLHDQFYPEIDNPFTLFGVLRNSYVSPNGSFNPKVSPFNFPLESSKVSYVYNNNNKLTNVKIWTTQRNNVVYQSITNSYKNYNIVYKYDMNGNLDKKEIYGCCEDSYNEKESLVAVVKYNWTGNILNQVRYFLKDGSDYMKVDITEDKLQSSTWRIGLQPFSKKTDNNGNIISFSYYDNNCINTNYGCYDYSYEYENGYLISITKTLTKKVDTRVKASKVRCEIKRNINGDIIKIYEDGSTRFKDIVWEYKYDNMGNWIEKSKYEDLKNDLPIKRLVQKFTRNITYYDKPNNSEVINNGMNRNNTKIDNETKSKSGNGGEVSDLTTDDEEDIKVFTKVEQEAYFPGGDAAWKAFLNNTIKANLRKSNGAPEGSYNVIVRFIVDKNGNVSDVAPETSYGYGMEAEAVRIMKASPKWEPARQNGKKVYSYKRQTINFLTFTSSNSDEIEVSVSAKNGGTFPINKSMLEGYQLQDELAKEKIYAKINIEPNGNATWVGFEKSSTSRDDKYKNAIIYCLPKINFEKASIAYQAICVFDFNGPLSNTLEKNQNSLINNNVEEESNPIISLDKMNVLYIGVDNPITLSFSNNSTRYSVTVNNGSMMYVRGSTAYPYQRRIRVHEVGKCTISIYDNITKKTFPYEYRIKRIPEPIFKIASGKINMSSVEFRSAQTCRAELENFDFDIRYNVVSATVKFSGYGFEQEISAALSGNNLSSLQPLLAKCGTGSIVRFVNIRVNGPDGERKIYPVTYYLE